MFGQYSSASHVVAHVSDTHLGAGDRAVYRGLHPGVHLKTVMDRLVAIGPDAIVFTGDIADKAEPGAYDAVAELVLEPAADMGAEVVWVMGNHDARQPFAQRLVGTEVDPEAPFDHVTTVNGLRIIALDSTIPGYHDGAISAAQLAWLQAELGSPAENGTILALHHPPIPTHLPLMALIELQNAHELADVVAGTDVRTIIAGHYHYNAHSLLGQIPVSVASSTCYSIDAGAKPLSGVDSGRSFDLLHVHADRVVHSTVPVETGRQVVSYPPEAIDYVAATPAEQRRELFAKAGSEVDEIGLVGGDTLEV